MATLPQINFLPGQRFECTACGKCCRGAWNIGVDEVAYANIKSSTSHKRKEKQGYVPLVVAEDGQASVGRKKDGGCVFLDDNNLCDVHGELGLEKKPLVCQSYPNLLTNTPDGYFVSLSFACPAVLDNAGTLMTEKKVRFQTMIEESGKSVPQNMPLGREVKLTDDVMIQWEDYLKLEALILKSFRPSQPGLSLLGMAEEIAAAAVHNGVGELLESGFSSLDGGSGYSQQLLELFTVNCLSIAELEEQPEARGAFMEALMNGEELVSLRHGARLSALDYQQKADLKDLNLIYYYLENILFGKRLTTHSVLDGLLTLAVGLTMLVYYLEIFRAESSDRESQEKAFELVEGDVVTHSRGLQSLLGELPAALLSYVGSSLDAAA